MPNVKGLLSDPDFNKLDPATQKTVLGRVDPDFASLSDSDYQSFRQKIGVDHPTAPNGGWIDPKVVEGAKSAAKSFYDGAIGPVIDSLRDIGAHGIGPTLDKVVNDFGTQLGQFAASGGDLKELPWVGPTSQKLASQVNSGDYGGALGTLGSFVTNVALSNASNRAALADKAKSFFGKSEAGMEPIGPGAPRGTTGNIPLKQIGKDAVKASYNAGKIITGGPINTISGSMGLFKTAKKYLSNSLGEEITGTKIPKELDPTQAYLEDMRNSPSYTPEIPSASWQILSPLGENVGGAEPVQTGNELTPEQEAEAGPQAPPYIEPHAGKGPPLPEQTPTPATRIPGYVAAGVQESAPATYPEQIGIPPSSPPQVATATPRTTPPASPAVTPASALPTAPTQVQTPTTGTSGAFEPAYPLQNSEGGVLSPKDANMKGARTVKARALANHLRITGQAPPAVGSDDWDVLAGDAGVNVPSETSQALAIEEFNKMKKANPAPKQGNPVVSSQANPASSPGLPPSKSVPKSKPSKAPASPTPSSPLPSAPSRLPEDGEEFKTKAAVGDIPAGEKVVYMQEPNGRRSLHYPNSKTNSTYRPVSEDDLKSIYGR